MKKQILLSASAVLVALSALTINTVNTRKQALAHHNATHGEQKLLAQNTIAQNTLTRLIVAFPTRGEATDAKRKADAAAKFLSTELGMPVEALVADETAAVEALRANRVDIAFLSSRGALKAEQLAGARLVLAEVRPNYSGGHTYKSILVVRKDSPLRSQRSSLQTLGQLRGKKMAFASRTSGSGFIIPTGEFVSRGLVSDPDRYKEFFGQVTYGDGYSSALQAVLRGQADIAAVSEYALAEPYIKGTEAQQLRILYSIPGVPAHGITIDDDVPAPMREKIVAALLKLNEPSNNQLLKDLGNATQLVKVNHFGHLGRMREALKRAKIDP